MPKKIKVKVVDNPQDGSGLVSAEELAAVAWNAAGLPGPPWKAEQIRDADGKVVAVIVNLPSSASDNARDAIMNHPGVSTLDPVISEPISLTDGTESFEDAIDGAALDSMGLLLARDLTSTATSEEASDGTLSQKYTNILDKNIIKSKYFYEYWLQPTPAYGFDGLRVKFKFKIGKIYDITAGEPGVEVLDPENLWDWDQFTWKMGHIQLQMMSGSVGIDGSPAGELKMWLKPRGNSAKNHMFDLTVTRDEWCTFECEYTGRGVMEATLTSAAGSESVILRQLELPPLYQQFDIDFFDQISQGNYALVTENKIYKHTLFRDEVEVEILSTVEV